MTGGQEQNCCACDGTGLTDKQQHTVELDANGKQVHATHDFTSSCSQCSGTGKVSG
ncbi:hypothetical protein AB0F13_20570 [Streptomyces sp. NPDC026206]|uniref:hypothetical protein n=1 Tax=Streptomyces sp. NPDC026206 TaxID=3157089 RepID=UPI0033E0F968